MTQVESTVQRFIRSLAEHFSGISSLLDEHLKHQLGVAIPHLFFWDVVNYVLNLARDGSPASMAEVRGIVNFLEDNFLESDEYYEVYNLIHVSFLEDIQHEGEITEKIVAMLGPRLTALWRQEGYRS